MSPEAWSAFWAVTIDLVHTLAAGGLAGWMLRGAYDRRARRRREEAR